MSYGKGCGYDLFAKPATRGDRQPGESEPVSAQSADGLPQSAKLFATTCWPQDFVPNGEKALLMRVAFEDRLGRRQFPAPRSEHSPPLFRQVSPGACSSSVIGQRSLQFIFSR